MGRNELTHTLLEGTKGVVTIGMTHLPTGRLAERGTRWLVDIHAVTSQLSQRSQHQSQMAALTKDLSFCDLGKAFPRVCFVRKPQNLLPEHADLIA